MTVIIAHDTPDAVRGLLKRWFVEPRPNVFVGTINRRTREKTLDYVRRNAPGLALLVLYEDASCQGFRVENWGDTDRRGVQVSGLWLVAEQWLEPERVPF